MRFIRAGLVAGAFALATMYGASPACAQTYWFETYQKTVALIDAGQHDAADARLTELLKQRPIPAAAVRIPGNQVVDYYPYFQRARIQHARGEHRKALHSLEVARAFGEMDRSRRDRERYAALRREVEQAAIAQAADPEEEREWYAEATRPAR